VSSSATPETRTVIRMPDINDHQRRKIVTKDQRNDGVVVDLNVDGINEVRRAAREREKTEELMDEL